MYYHAELSIINHHGNVGENLKRFHILVSKVSGKSDFGILNLQQLTDIIYDTKKSVDKWAAFRASVLGYIKYRSLFLRSKQLGLNNIQEKTDKIGLNPLVDQIAESLIKGCNFMVVPDCIMKDYLQLAVKELGGDFQIFTFG